MRLSTFTHEGQTRVGIVTGDEIIDTQRLTGIPDNMIEFLESDLINSETIREIADTSIQRIKLTQVQLRAPILRPPKFLAVGLNYLDHIEETNAEKPEVPTIFNKQSTCVIGTEDTVHLPRVSDKLDYEGELGIVIGQRCRHVSKENAHAVIAGYTIVNDVSVRDWQMRSHTWTMGKSFDTHGPVGPWMVTPDEIGDPHKLDIKTWVNDELRQSSNTKHLLFDCYALIEFLTTAFTLEVGDIISTGTSSGVGSMMKPRTYLKPGDVISVEIEKIGKLVNEVIDEPDY
jgi:2-keto-4-pentenoate hydratase/2-oxohepta-3-ene-1,7-dioic acid hydratase in catechol pathway